MKRVYAWVSSQDDLVVVPVIADRRQSVDKRQRRLRLRLGSGAVPDLARDDLHFYLLATRR